jgi:hypothetical protein
VIIVEGASVRGKVDMGDLEMPRPASDRKPVYTPKPMTRPSAPAEKPKPTVKTPAKKAAPPPKAKKAPPPKAKPAKKKKKVVVKKKKRR